MQATNAANSPTPPPLPFLTDPWMVRSDERSLAMLCHLLGIFTGFLGPLIIWLIKKDESAFIDHHGREAVNFQLTVMLIMLCLGSVTFVLMFILIGLVLVPLVIIVPVLALIAEIIAAIAAQNGEWYRYPCNIRMV